MGLSDLRARLRADATSPRHQRQFDAARSREPEFNRFECVEAVLEVLEHTGCEASVNADRIIRAMVREHQRSTTTLWASILLVIFAPILGRLQARTRRIAVDPTDLLPTIIEAFLAAIARQRTDETVRSVAGYLSASTQRLALARLQAERDQHRRQQLLERYARGNDAFDLYSWPVDERISASELEPLVELLFAIAGRSLAKPKLDAIVATRLRGMTLREYVAIHLGEAPSEHERFEIRLQRAKREQSRALSRLRPLLRKRLAMLEDEQRLSDVWLAHAS
ncbi:MAG TPA: hypothetical protein VKP30_04865 [Polyangiaceae bacterium]|nr:hypothetical protein [Polyangiaceae bacterium]